ncbi:MAG: hypothetical protein FD171_1932 [Actinobacteria bacterium]|nr:MAG: hypothetical protein FD171_1932 [Actinomycetota bacterium]
MVDGAIDVLDLLAPTSGFSWHYPVRTKVKHRIASIRHIQLNEARLASRVYVASGTSVGWVGGRAISEQ